MISINRYFDAAVNDKYNKRMDYVPSENVAKRINELGLSQMEEMTKKAQLNELEEKVWMLVPTVKKPLLIYDSEDYLKVIDFLEVWTMYSTGFHVLTLVDERPENYPKFIKMEDMYYDKTVIKLIKELEDLKKIVTGSPVSATDLKAKVKMIKRHVDKVFSESLGRTEKMAFGETIKTAKDILANLV